METTFNREFSRIEPVNNSLNQKNTMLSFLNEAYVKRGIVFFAFRNRDNIIGYCYGGKLFDLKKQTKGTKVLPTSRDAFLQNTIEQESFFIEDEPTFDSEKEKIYKTIISNIKARRECSEVSAVSGLYKFSPMSNYVLDENNCVLLDIEADFAIPGGGKKENRVDVVLYNPVLQQLMFVEVKLLKNKELRSQGEIEPHIIDQLQRYNSIVKDNKLLICNEYNKVISYYNYLTGKNMPQVDEKKDIKLALLITGFNEEEREKDVKKLVEELQTIFDNKEELKNARIFYIGNISNASQNTFKRKWFNW